MNVGQLFFHQGWTDIFNCLALVNYYMQSYDTLYVFIREDAYPLFHFYVKQFGSSVVALVDKKPEEESELPLLENVDHLIHGDNDVYGKDAYKGRFSQTSVDFVKSFYVCYDIPYSTRITHFDFERDLELEDATYRNFVEEYGEIYGLKHSVALPDGISEVPLIELNQRSEIFFDSIKICEHAKEMRLLDSSWACFLSLLDLDW
jgi:hypothetical protein